MLGEIWETVVDVWEHITGFEWLSDIGEISIMGILFSIVMMLFVFLLRGYMMDPFLKHMSSGTAFFWMIATYVTCAIVGYLVGKGLLD